MLQQLQTVQGRQRPRGLRAQVGVQEGGNLGVTQRVDLDPREVERLVIICLIPASDDGPAAIIGVSKIRLQKLLPGIRPPPPLAVVLQPGHLVEAIGQQEYLASPYGATKIAWQALVTPVLADKSQGLAVGPG